jgi:hypothetical protein
MHSSRRRVRSRALSSAGLLVPTPMLAAVIRRIILRRLRCAG